MRLACLDAFAGISGDMFMAALLDAGAPADLLCDTLERLDLGARLRIRRVDRAGIQALKADVLVGDAPAEETPAPVETVRARGRSHDHAQAAQEHRHSPGEIHAHAPRRSLASIRHLLLEADLPGPVAELALRTFEELGRAEAKIHGIPPDAVHFHEVGAVDAIADIVLAATAVQALKIEAWHCSPLNVGGGTVRCAHGCYPVPAPATAELLRGAPTYSSGVAMELVTPTGAALVRALPCRFEPAPVLRVERIGYGAGGRNPEGLANVLRLSIGETEPAASGAAEVVTVIETAVDDLNPQIIPYAVEKAIQLGALDVFCAPVQMKKNRPGTLITVLVPPEKAGAVQDLLLRETSSLGLRVRQDRRICLPREFVPVETPWGPVRVKVARRDGAEWNAAPEYEDCRALAERHAVPLKQVMAAALQAHRREHPL